MKFSMILGLPLSILGLILSFPPLQTLLGSRFGEIGGAGGTVMFASGWALLAAYLAFNLGMESQRKKNLRTF